MMEKTMNFISYITTKRVLLLCALPLLTHPFSAGANTLNSFDFSDKPEGAVSLVLFMSEPLNSDPKSFSLDQPPRISIDLENTSSSLNGNQFAIGAGAIKDIQVIESGSKSRVILNLKQVADYSISRDGKQVKVEVSNTNLADKNGGTGKPDQPSITAIDFEKAENGLGRVIVGLTQPDVSVNMSSKNKNVILDFLGVKLPQRLNRTLSISEFGTPAQQIETVSNGGNVVMTIRGEGDFQHYAYQASNQFIIEFAPNNSTSNGSSENSVFTGERLSLNFQSIEVRAILQLLADFTDKNLVASDSVGGSITLRLKNVPWDQALDIILKARGLGKREVGNVMMVAPQEELTARERLELESQQQYLELSPLRTEFVQVNYAKAIDMATIIRNEANNLISERGNITVDERTNTLLIQETDGYLKEIKNILKALDIPVRQVQIESKIVIANDDFSKDLGVKLGYSLSANPGIVGGNPNVIIGGGINGDAPVGTATSFINTEDATFPKENYQVSLPVAGPAGALRMMIGKQGSYLLNLELQAAQAEGRGDIISTPTVITANQREAAIESGTEIPFLEASSSGATSVSFKKAVLSLRVTPQITPDNRIIMDLKVNKDSVGTIFSGIPSIDTNNLITQVLVEDGETVVLGGVYESTDTDNRRSIPVLGEIPIVGRLFRSNSRSEKKKELLVFITPRILDQGLVVSP